MKAVETFITAISKLIGSMNWPLPMKTKQEGFFVNEAKQRIMEIRALREKGAKNFELESPQKENEERQKPKEMSSLHEYYMNRGPRKETRSGCIY